MMHRLMQFSETSAQHFKSYLSRFTNLNAADTKNYSRKLAHQHIGHSKKKDLNGDGFNPSDLKILHQIPRASVFGETPSDAQTVGDLRRQQVAYGASLYRPSSRHVKGVSFADAAHKAILAQQFKGVAGAYTMSEKHSLARAIQRACKKKLSCDKP